jgi:hypothetical protein
LNKRYVDDNINDGIISVKWKGNLLAQGNIYWIRLSWDKPQLVDKIVIFNYPSETKRILSGQLKFSDGSTIDVAFPTDESAKSVEFEEKKRAISTLVLTKAWVKIWGFP